jgi:cytochrome c peroxidase
MGSLRFQTFYAMPFWFSIAIFLGGCSENRVSGEAEQSFELPALGTFLPVSPLPGAPDPEAPIVQLGKSLFHDQRLSSNGSISCASCHDIAAGGDDGRVTSIGLNGEKTSVNAPTVLNSTFNFAQFWDGRARTIEDQIRETLVSEIEMGADLSAMERRLRRDDELVSRFDRLYQNGLNTDNVIDAIAAYVDALVTPGAPFDRFLNGDSTAVSKEVAAGYQLFTDLGCISCHQGRNLGGNLFQTFGIMGDYFADRGDVTIADYGRFNVTGREQDRYKFKVPTLRNVARTAPYFHDGSAATLEDAIKIMVQYQLGRNVEPSELLLLVAFLESLSADVSGPLL